eukprot:SAG22_NODE_5554_length_993_cov_6.309843_2_plen_71_part_00
MHVRALHHVVVRLALAPPMRNAGMARRVRQEICWNAGIVHILWPLLYVVYERIPVLSDSSQQALYSCKTM